MRAKVGAVVGLCLRFGPSLTGCGGDSHTPANAGSAAVFPPRMPASDASAPAPAAQTRADGAAAVGPREALTECLRSALAGPESAIRDALDRCRSTVAAASARERVVAFPDGGPAGWLPPELLQEIVRLSFGRFRSCYEAGLQRDATLAGRIEMRFVIDQGGRVVDAKSTGRVGRGSQRLPDETVHECVADRFAKLRFPKPDGDGPVEVVYPIIFTPSSD